MIQGDIFYFDPDTLITGNPAPYLHDDRFRMFSDFYHPEKPVSGMMFIPHNKKTHIWNAWMADQQKWMHECRGGQDIGYNVSSKNSAKFIWA